MERAKSAFKFFLICFLFLGCDEDSPFWSEDLGSGTVVFYSLKPCENMELFVDDVSQGFLFPLDQKPDSSGNIPIGAIKIVRDIKKKESSAFTRIDKGKWVYKSNIQKHYLSTN